MKEDKPLPKLDFNITNRCNFRCRHCCFASGEVMLNEFSLEKIKNILAEFITLSGQRIDITGGEPTLRHDYLEIIDYAKKIGLKVELVTNGSLITEDQLKKLRVIGLDAIAVSLDGSNYEIYKKTRPVDRMVYERIIQNIKLIIQHGFYLKINTVVRNSNLLDLVKINDLAIKVGASEHGFYYFTPVGRGRDDCREVVDPLVWLDLVRDKLVSRQKYIKLSLETALVEDNLCGNNQTECYLKNPWHLQILPDGNVYPCAIMAAIGASIGNLFDSSLTDIWQDKRLWDGSYYKKNVLPLIERYGTCVNFGQNFKQVLMRGYKPVCLMCKYKTKEPIREKPSSMASV